MSAKSILDKKINKISLTVFILILFVSCADDKAAADYEYLINNKKELVITGYTGESNDLVIPKKINRRPVKILEDDAFAFKELNSVVIPDTVTIIGNNTFAGNKLTDLHIPESVFYIGKNAFLWNQLTSIVIPDAVVFIGDAAFHGSKLTKITLPSNADIELNAFNVLLFDYYNKNGKQAGTFEILFTAYDDYHIAVLNNNCAEIVAFTGSHKEVIIPDVINNFPVTAIGYSSFFGMSLTSVKIPNTVTIIGPHAFAGNNLGNFTIPDSVKIIGNNAFRESAITNVVIPNSVTVIGDNAFTHNKLTSVIIPDSVTSIGEQAFTYNQLTGINIPDSVISIGHFAFIHNQITDVTIPASVTDLGFSAFDPDVTMVKE